MKQQRRQNRSRLFSLNVQRLGISALSAIYFMFVAISLNVKIQDTDFSQPDLWTSIIIGLIAYIFIGWTIFAKPYVALITSKKKLKLAVEEAEKLAQFPINNPHPIVQIDRYGSIIYANPAALEQFPSLEDLGFMHPALQGLDQYLKDPLLRDTVERELACNTHIYSQTITPVIINHKPALVVYCYNITQIRHVQEKARLLEAAIVNAKDGVILTKADMDNPEIVFANDAVVRITGYEKSEIIGQTPRMFQGSGTNIQTLTRLRDALRNGETFQGELLNYRKNGSAYWLDLSIVPVRNEAGEVTHYAAIERDITERKAFEKEMQINKEAAEVASRAKGDFLANMSHELRTPMNGIIGLSELLTEMSLHHEAHELTEAINTSSRNLLILLNDILDLSKIEAGELTLEYIPFETARVVRQTVDLLRPLSSKKSVVLESNISPLVPSRIICDPARLQQILNNLVSNAIKFTEIGYVRLDVSCIRDGAGDPVLQIRVEDTGIGIPKDKQDAVFNKFTQADVSTARKYGGTGLGLTITKELVEMMGGRIGFDSVLGKGTTFFVEIPVEEAAAEEVKDKSRDVSKFDNYNTDTHILIVDDHPVNLLFLSKVLQKLGFKFVDQARSGKEAIEMSEIVNYELVFMDCQMPEIDGFEASTIIREREEKIGDTKIIAVTADAMKGAREKCIDAGMNDYISKPVDTAKLQSILCRWIPREDKNIEQGNEKNSTPTEILMQSDTCNNETNKDMPVILDRERLEMFTDGDPDEELNLLNIFTTYALEALNDLHKSIDTDNNDMWKKAAHKLKGSAANLGAIQLSELCLEAEMNETADKARKLKLLNEIEAAYTKLKNYVSTPQMV